MTAGQAIPFIEIIGDGHLQVSAEAMNALEKHQTRKIAVVSFCGVLASGKSFLANQLLDRIEPAGTSRFDTSNQAFLSN